MQIPHLDSEDGPVLLGDETGFTVDLETPLLPRGESARSAPLSQLVYHSYPSGATPYADHPAPQNSGPHRQQSHVSVLMIAFRF